MSDPAAPWAGLYDSLGRPLDKMPDKIHPGTNTVLFDNGRVLLHRRSDNGAWALPGGAMEIGESAEECAVRETWEETGLQVRIKRFVGVYSDPVNYCILRYPNGYTVHYVILLYEVEQIGGELAISAESTELAFFPVGNLPEEIMPSSRMRVLDAWQRRAEAFSR